MTKIILFNGAPRSGKDTAATIASEILNNELFVHKFAAPLKKAVHEMFGFTGVPTDYFEDVKDMPNGALYNMTPRQAYIWLSEEIIKPKFGKQFFGHSAVNAIRTQSQEIVVMSDCGFNEEVAPLVDAFGAENVAVVHIFRAGTSFKDDSRNYIDKTGGKFYTIINNGTLSELRDRVEEVVINFTIPTFHEVDHE